jgi:hypothetical protein
MAVVWTPELIAKAKATRAANKAAAEAKTAKKAAKSDVGQHVEVVTLSETADYPVSPLPSIPVVLPPTNGSGVNWNAIPIDEAMNRLADMKREYDRIAQIVMKRQTQNKPTWTCWTQLHKDLVKTIEGGKKVLEICKKGGEDGKWASRDDGVFKIVDGLRIPDPVFCCNSFCHSVYLRSKPMGSLSRH